MLRNGRAARRVWLPTMADDTNVDFGTTLRQAREKRGVSLQQIAATTKISARVLDALERNDPSKLPGGIFSRAFVRAYAREVGLDPEITVAQFIEKFPPDVAPVTPVTVLPGEDPEAFESGRRAATTTIQLVAISVVVIVAVAVYLSMRPSRAPRSPAAEPAAATSGPAAPTPAQPVAGESTGGTPSGETSAPAEAVREPAATVPAAAAAPDAAPGEAALRLVLSARTPCWVSLSVDGRRVLGRVLEAGERASFDARGEALLNVGDAAALALTINGTPARPLGGPGAVVNLRITPDNYKALLQTP